MFKRILVCLDGSKLAEAILPYATEQAKVFESELILFRSFTETQVISPAMPGMPGIPIETKTGEKHLVQHEVGAEIYLKSLVGKIQAENKLTISYEIMLGAAGPAIVEYAQKQGIELIAISTHGRGGLRRAVLGSVSDYVVKHSNIPILLIRPAEIETV